MLIYVIQHIKQYLFDYQHNKYTDVVELLW